MGLGVGSGSFGLLTGATIVAMSVGFQHQLGNVASRALVVWGVTPPPFTAVLLPIVTFLLA